MGISPLDIQVLEKVLFHVTPIRVPGRRHHSDVFIQVERAAQRKIQLLFLVQSNEVTINILHRLASGESQHQVWVGAKIVSHNPRDE
jgi:hypothetical protein